MFLCFGSIKTQTLLKKMQAQSNTLDQLIGCHDHLPYIECPVHMSLLWYPKTVNMDKKWQKKQSIILGGRLYLTKMDYGPCSSLKERVALVNDDLMVGQWGIKCYLLQVQHEMKYCSLRSAPIITSSVEMKRISWEHNQGSARSWSGDNSSDLCHCM